MPLQITNDSPGQFPKLNYLTLNKFNRGVITLIDQSRLPTNALKTAQNIFLVEDGIPTPRPGVDWYGAAAGGAIDGADAYYTSAGTPHLLKITGGVVYRSTNNGGSWSSCSGATTTAGLKCYFNQYNGYMHITNGTDNIIRYDGSTTLVTYTALSTPAAPTVAQTGLGTTAIQYLYKVSAVNTVGFSVASSVGTGDTKFTTTRDAWSATAYATISCAAVTGATRYDIFISEDGVNYYYLDSAVPATVGAAVAYRDDGTAVVVPSTTAPIANTTQGPLVAELTNIGSRMYGVRDSANPYRIWFSSSTTPKGAFSSAYDGGYLDWQEGGKYFPVKVADYRDGKNTPLATIWCKSPDGRGCIIQMSLDILTIGDISITVPSANILPGSRGTSAPGSVVNVLNDYMFYNAEAFFNLGSRAQFLNLLSTDEVSSNIRPTVRTITNTGAPNICSIFHEAKVYFSVPLGTTANNYTMVYDTERKAWLPQAFTMGFERFFRYVDSSGYLRLLAWRPNDSKLSQISEDIDGDYGVAFDTILETGLYPISKNRFEFMFTEEAEFELSQPVGTITIDLKGIDRVNGLVTLASKNFTTTASTTNTGWDTFLWDTTLWDDTSSVVPVTSSSSDKHYFTVQKEINAYQWKFTTSATNATYLMRTLQLSGTVTESGKPRGWRLI